MLYPARSCSSVSSASFTAFSLGDSITYASFTIFPDIKNSCVFRANLSAVQSNLNCNLKKLCFAWSFLNETFTLFFFLSPKVSARNPVRQSISEESFSSAKSPGTHTITGKYSLSQWPYMQTCNSPASSGTLGKGERHQFPATNQNLWPGPRITCNSSSCTRTGFGNILLPSQFGCDQE